MKASALLSVVVCGILLFGCGNSETERAAPDPTPTAMGATGTASAMEGEAAGNQAERPEAPTARAEGEPTNAAEGTAENRAASPSVEGDSFRLEATAGEGYTAGALAQFGIAIEHKGEWHVNQDYPFSVTLHGPEGLSFPKDRLGKDDAAEFGDDGIRVEVPFTPSAAGEAPVSADVSFAMCNPQTCVMERHTVALNLAVE